MAKDSNAAGLSWGGLRRSNAWRMGSAYSGAEHIWYRSPSWTMRMPRRWKAYSSARAWMAPSTASSSWASTWHRWVTGTGSPDANRMPSMVDFMS